MMRVIALVTLVAGLLAAAFTSVEQLAGIGWKGYLVSLSIAFLGALLVRATSEERGGGMLILNVQVIRSSLTMLAAKLRNLDRAKRDEIGVFGINAFIDRHLVPDVARFTATREALIYKHGLEAYGRVMDAFSAGERALNRAWSASADGYVDEVDLCLDRAREQFERALAMVDEAER